jgi:hypothetical protein
MAIKPTQIRNVVIEWHEVKRAYLAAVENGKKITAQPHMNKKIDNWYKNPTRRSDWEGGSPADTCAFLRDGYHANTFAHSAEYAAISNRSRFAYNEDEGEIDIDRVLDGHDAIFLDREERPSRPGLRLMVEFSFASGIPAEVISQYGAWVASLIQSLEATGYDLVIDVWINLNRLFVGDGDSYRTNVLVRVKQENEQSNFTDWSALFGPTGYRHLGFLAKALAARKCKSVITSSFGGCVWDKAWGVTYDRDNQNVMINVDQINSVSSLPVDKLNADAIKEGLIPEAIKIDGMKVA